MKLGIDIGGTKCALVLGDERQIFRKVRFSTTSFHETLDRILNEAQEIGEFDEIGISCGGPLDSKLGMILSPPNLPGWDEVPITSILEERFGKPAHLCNDANACALAEWKYGAGVGASNMIFLTFGTGMGAGVIVNGMLLDGTCGMAGEIGHVRMAKKGPIGYGKRGSFEGFCSGGGLAQLGRFLAEKALKKGGKPSFCENESELSSITAKTLADAAREGDPIAKRAFHICGKKLGEGLSILIDVLNPEVIVIGSIFARAEDLLRAPMESALRKEALSMSYEVCRIVPAQLGEQIGDFAALAVAHGYHLR